MKSVLVALFLFYPISHPICQGYFRKDGRKDVPEKSNRRRHPRQSHRSTPKFTAIQARFSPRIPLEIDSVTLEGVQRPIGSTHYMTSLDPIVFYDPSRMTALATKPQFLPNPYFSFSKNSFASQDSTRLSPSNFCKRCKSERSLRSNTTTFLKRSRWRNRNSRLLISVFGKP